MEQSSISKNKFLYSVIFGIGWVITAYIGMGFVTWANFGSAGYHMVQWHQITNPVILIWYCLQELLVWTVGFPFAFPYYILGHLLSFMADDSVGREALQTGLTIIVPFPLAIYLVYQGWSIKEKYSLPRN